VAKTRSDLVNCIARAEAREQLEKDVRQEMTDFFEESARYAATVVGELTRERETRANERIETEVRDFFAEALAKAAALAERLRLDQADPSLVVEELEAVLRGVAGAVHRAAKATLSKPTTASIVRSAQASPAPERPARSGGRKPPRERPSHRVEPHQPRRRPGESRRQG
jgi:hypothetical protein